MARVSSVPIAERFNKKIPLYRIKVRHTEHESVSEEGYETIGQYVGKNGDISIFLTKFDAESLAKRINKRNRQQYASRQQSK